ncbi:hypothetical protein ACCT03_20225 [Rhizobium johnstonii]|uniref:hypothetical protein n=1 Tax=Rhizobium TaxID=379 RepID=UPI00102F76AA|nr:hypothetical protein [Rhizobium leguminosarum]MBY5324795.1 hypothetical protein [Rhizobium leguminosarum]MBY5385605.1 hypothetical protein [Rhizobium leguminosarum]MCA2436425.1 hypothetical protein [Rhizobium leguminosarum]NEH69091.1 hypothetical protein [Rhizobium leguminosarum]TBF69320.1 hypothetical protein ELG86_30790 [Rhizobium leguminosarum]
MPYKVDVYVARTYAAVTVKDWLTNSPCVDTETNQKIENVPVNPSATFHTSVGHKGREGIVTIEATDTKSQASSDEYKIPVDLDAKGTITFPKEKAASQSDLHKLGQDVQALKQSIQGGAPPR